ncbi:MAG TPA: hypothetical protein PK228_10520, partial [Saprospiraceae bacterium]|nr:hypothetical protein [Saprospiraceae bacterium]
MRRFIPIGFLISTVISSACCQKVHLLRLGDTLFLPPATDSIILLRPVYGDFEQTDSLIRLCYVRDTIFPGKFLPAKVLGPGTHFLAAGTPEADTLCSRIP